MVRLVPRETKFFDMFAEMSGNLTRGARLLGEIRAREIVLAGPAVFSAAALDLAA